MAISMIKLQTLNLKKLIRVSEVDVILFSLAFTFVFFTTRYQLNATREFYFWDNAGYHNIVLQMMDRLHSAPKLDFFRDLYHSFSDEISNLFAVPLLPFMELFGESRFIFILSMAFCYLLPTVFLTAWFCSRLVDSHRRLTFWVTTFLLLLSPFCWMSILDGRPDIGGVGIVLLAIILQCFSPAEKKGGWKPILSGVLLGLAILFRRQFIVSVVSFFFAFGATEIILFSILSLQKNSSKEIQLRQFYNKMAKLILIGIAMAAVLGTIGFPFTQRYLMNDIREQYSSYLAVSDRGWRVGTQFLFSFFSIPVLVLTFIGYGASFKFRIKSEIWNRMNLASFLFLVSWFLIWNLGVAPARHNYAISVFWCIPIGLLALIFTFNQLFQKKTYYFSFFFIGTLFLVNGFVLFSHRPIPKYLLPEPIIPIVRTDYNEMLNLVKDLKVKTTPNSPILVAGSSWILNEGVLANAETQLVGRKNRQLNILGILHADSYKHIPIKELLKAEWVVVPSPFQWHMRPDVQQCVQVLHDAFIDSWEISKDFELTPKRYQLNDGVIVKIFHRIKSTSSEVEQLTLVRMKNRILKKIIHSNT